MHNRDTYKTALASVEDGLGKTSLDSAAETLLAGPRLGLLVAAKFVPRNKDSDGSNYRSEQLLVQLIYGETVFMAWKQRLSELSARH